MAPDKISILSNLEELIIHLGKVSNEMEQLPDRQMIYNLQLFVMDAMHLINNDLTRDMSTNIVAKIDEFIFVRNNRIPQMQQHKLLPIDASDIHLARVCVKRCERMLEHTHFSSVRKTLNSTAQWLYLVARMQTRAPTWVTQDQSGNHKILK
jgi:cob(I)alamin adenosyltransferase